MDVCRVCLVEEADVFFSLFSKLEHNSIAEMISVISGLEIAKGDGLPRYICKECSEEILECYKVRRKCLDSDRQLRNALEESQTKIKMMELYLKKEILKEKSSVGGIDMAKAIEIPADVLMNMANQDNLMNIVTSQEHNDIGECSEQMTVDVKVLDMDEPTIKTDSTNHDTVIYSKIDKEEPIESVEDTGVCTEVHVGMVHESEARGDVYETVQDPAEEDFEYTEEFLDMARDDDEIQYSVETGSSEYYLIHPTESNTQSDESEGKMICCGCEMQFSTDEELKQHSTEEHEKMRVKNSAKPYECHICYKRFLSEQRLILHQTYAYREKNHICEKCSSRFTCRGSLMNHMKTHAERTYTCEICSKSFFTSSTLQSHRILHTDSKQFKCTEPTCSKSFLRKSDLHIHLVSHSDERPFICDICSSRFKSKAHLVHHGKVHTREKPYKCGKCDKAFGTYSARNVHQLAHEGPHTTYSYG
ncbi:zinc finger protein 239-like isoform X2 [Toxorhynchites rutilus septentrionalis]|uniref:zinc finger protein 239-like isoform X2 n=1 Tax=Toxorhynchites rutilus septentrionalis TaxID=329112 RepID=UPI0024797DA1|nr:zinc finger protein 239-like isoform X2 [Toxorhynchites rutilus septentrionalis]